MLPLVFIAWSYWPIIKVLFEEWQSNDDYSAGQIVPLIALFLVWRERKLLRECPLKPCWAGGIALLVLAEVASIHQFLVGAHPSIERYLIIIALSGLILMVTGWQVFRKVSWILLFLFLMVPLPGRVHNFISGPLQTMATTGSVSLLESFGVNVSQQGNVILLNNTIPMAVAEACSGLRMLTAFVIAAAFMAYMVKSSPLKKAILLLSSIPVAVMCNILRLCVTAILFIHASSQVAEKFFHDFAGLAMMPVAVILMFIELWMLDRLIVPEPNPHHNEKKIRTQPRSRIKATLNE
jgi:exosortase